MSPDEEKNEDTEKAQGALDAIQSRKKLKQDDRDNHPHEIIRGKVRTPLC